MHEINLSKLDLRTDLILDQNNDNLISNEYKYKDIKVINSSYNKYKYTTIYYSDITDTNNYLNLEKIIIKELKKYIKVKKRDSILIVGLGNISSTPDSLGPKTLEHILVTRHLKLLNILDENYNVVSIFQPSVIGKTGLESITLINNVIKSNDITKVIVIDALKANNTDRLLKTIQITDSGIHPGSGINNDRGEISKEKNNIDVISIGIPTVVDIKTILENILEEKVELKENLILTPTDIDYLIDKLSYLLGTCINKSIHKLYPTK